jgi:hypothetical protein
MIHSPITLVLGAGASHPYGYPLGSELRDLLVAPVPDLSALVSITGIPKADIDSFAKEFLQSNLSSIDVFLERRPKLAKIGRTLIAAVILRHDAHLIHGDWYSYLWNQMTRGAPTLDDFRNNKLSVITFNYDTSFERFMVNSLRAAYDVTLDRARDAFATVKLIHVHGQVPFALDANSLVPSEVSASGLAIYRDKIVTLHEGQDDSEAFVMARGLMRDASHVVFLGFGFHPENMRRLRGENLQFVTGTTHGLLGDEVRRIRNLFKYGPDLRDIDCLTLLRERVLLFD